MLINAPQNKGNNLKGLHNPNRRVIVNIIHKKLLLLTQEKTPARRAHKTIDSHAIN
jgi:hypothetical protein